MALKHEGSTGVAAAGGVWLQLGGCGCSWGGMALPPLRPGVTRGPRGRLLKPMSEAIARHPELSPPPIFSFL